MIYFCINTTGGGVRVVGRKGKNGAGEKGMGEEGNKKGGVLIADPLFSAPNKLRERDLSAVGFRDHLQRLCFLLNFLHVFNPFN